MSLVQDYADTLTTATTSHIDDQKSYILTTEVADTAAIPPTMDWYANWADGMSAPDATIAAEHARTIKQAYYEIVWQVDGNDSSVLGSPLWMYWGWVGWGDVADQIGSFIGRHRKVIAAFGVGCTAGLTFALESGGYTPVQLAALCAVGGWINALEY